MRHSNRENPNFSRRRFINELSAVTGVISTGLSATELLAQNKPAPRRGAQTGKAFPKGFWWGAATAAHQVEGNNVNSDFWRLEQAKPTIFQEPSGDACDHYHRYPQDIKLLAGLGFNAYRFSVEWARIEPEPGVYSQAEIEHYRRMAATCRENGLTPMITYHHFTSPRWLAAMGGWESAAAADRFLRFCERVTKGLGDLTGAACTFNEPNIPLLLRWMKMPMPMDLAMGMMQAAAKASGADRFSVFLFGDPQKIGANMLATHRRAVEAIKSGPGEFPVGVTLAMQDEQAVGPDNKRDEKRADVYDRWLETASKDDFIGVQTYTRARVGADGDLPPEQGVELTQMGYEFWPEALEQTIRYAHAKAKVPVIVTENGVATDDDSKRIEYLRRALAGVQRCLDDGLAVRGYFHWSLFDNFEWVFGYRPKFGMIGVNRETQKRTVKPSAKFLGQVARRNRLN